MEQNNQQLLILAFAHRYIPRNRQLLVNILWGSYNKSTSFIFVFYKVHNYPHHFLWLSSRSTARFIKKTETKKRTAWNQFSTLLQKYIFIYYFSYIIHQNIYYIKIDQTSDMTFTFKHSHSFIVYNLYINSQSQVSINTICWEGQSLKHDIQLSWTKEASVSRLITFIYNEN